MYSTLSKLAVVGLIATALLVAASGGADVLEKGSGYICSVTG